MEDNHNTDELIEIKPDIIQDNSGDTDTLKEPNLIEDEDMKVVPKISVPDEDEDMKIIPEKNVQDEDEDMKVVSESEDFSKEFYDVETEEEDMKLINEIGKSLKEETEQNLVSEEFTLTSVEEVAAAEDGVPAHRSFKDLLKTIPLWAYIVSGAALVIIIFSVSMLVINIGKDAIIDMGSDYAAERMNYQPVEQIPVIDIPDDIDTDMLPNIEVIDESDELLTPTLAPTGVVEDKEEQQVYNILILGEENLEKGSVRGRSDLIMIATINKKDQRLKLTSLMRDILVAIPDHSDNRLNAAYAMGGVSLTYQTLANNLGVTLDNYVCVDFDSFEKIIDAIGGVDMELTKEEADYLNKTNYIKDEKSRNLKKGINHLNGDQALGYCRIRKVGTAGNEYSDFGRTSRQRELIESICKSFAGLSLGKLKDFCDTCLKYIRTDIDADTLERYINDVYEIGLDKDIMNYRIPIDGTYSDANLRGMLVTKVDLRENAEKLNKFIYGE